MITQNVGLEEKLQAKLEQIKSKDLKTKADILSFLNQEDKNIDSDLRIILNDIIVSVKSLMKQDKTVDEIKQLIEGHLDKEIVDGLMRYIINNHTYIHLSILRKLEVPESKELVEYLFKNFVLRYNGDDLTYFEKYGIDNSQDITRLYESFTNVIMNLVNRRFGQKKITDFFTHQYDFSVELSELIARSIEDNYLELKIDLVNYKVDKFLDSIYEDEE